MDNAVKIKLEAGFFKDGTEYQAAGRWADGDLVRWHNANIKTINGWQVKADFGTDGPLSPLWGAAADEAARSGIATGDTVGGVDTYIGTNSKIYRLTNSNVVSDVTPTGFLPKLKDAKSNSGYGAFRYSYGQYGVARPATAAAIPMVFSWGFSSWGEWPVAVARGDDALKVLIKQPTDAKFVPIAASPAGANDILVTDERFLMTFGTPTDGKLVQWSDRERYDVWAPAIDNQAGSYRLSGTGALVCGVKVLGQILLLSDNDAFSGQFVGPPYVYGFSRVGSRCGIIGPEAVVVTETFAAWFGARSFWIFDGVVRQLDCSVLDYVLANASPSQRSKTCGFTISDYSECWWLYQSRNSVTSEPDSYVVYNYAKNCWYTGTLDRTMGMDNDPSRTVVMVAPDGRVYDHEVLNAGHDGRVPFVVTGPLELANGERVLGISYIFPDAQPTGAVRMELQVRDMPGEANSRSMLLYSRDFELLRPTATHGIMGRDIRMRLYGAGLNSHWVIGDFRMIPVKGAGPCR